MTDTPGDVAAKSPTIEEMLLTLENAAQCEDAGRRLECLLSGLEPPPGESVNAATLRAAASLIREMAEREAALINGMSILEGMRCKRIEELEARDQELAERRSRLARIKNMSPFERDWEKSFDVFMAGKHDELITKRQAYLSVYGDFQYLCGPQSPQALRLLEAAIYNTPPFHPAPPEAK